MTPLAGLQGLLVASPVKPRFHEHLFRRLLTHTSSSSVVLQNFQPRARQHPVATTRAEDCAGPWRKGEHVSWRGARRRTPARATTQPASSVSPIHARHPGVRCVRGRKNVPYVETKGGERARLRFGCVRDGGFGIFPSSNSFPRVFEGGIDPSVKRDDARGADGGCMRRGWRAARRRDAGVMPPGSEPAGASLRV